ncbi:PilN domain-containing protein [Wukongibacter baidiensis]|uniref:PilN domain-containing protein n=1 Tax=Wukongibacter baidiensis TaxID=1723361 RepID=UPI003D7F2F1F
MKDFNFFSSFIETKKTSQYKYAIYGVILALIVVGLGSFNYINFLKAKELEKDAMNLKEYLNSQEVTEKLKEVEKKKKDIAIMEKYYTTLEEININIDSIDVVKSGLMEEISATIPKDLFIRNMILSYEGMQLQGISKKRLPIAEFEHNLKKLDIFNKVHVTSINQESEDSDNYMFTMIFTFKDVSKNEAN